MDSEITPTGMWHKNLNLVKIELYVRHRRQTDFACCLSFTTSVLIFRVVLQL